MSFLKMKILEFKLRGDTKCGTRCEDVSSAPAQEFDFWVERSVRGFRSSDKTEINFVGLEHTIKLLERDLLAIFGVKSELNTEIVLEAINRHVIKRGMLDAVLVFRATFNAIEIASRPPEPHPIIAPTQHLAPSLFFEPGIPLRRIGDESRFRYGTVVDFGEVVVNNRSLMLYTDPDTQQIVIPSYRTHPVDAPYLLIKKFLLSRGKTVAIREITKYEVAISEHMSYDVDNGLCCPTNQNLEADFNQMIRNLNEEKHNEFRKYCTTVRAGKRTKA